jgi:hypothetical protein
MTMFHIRELLISERQEEHIWTKHHVSVDEVDDVCGAARLVLRGRDGSYAVYGQTATGRYLVLFLYPRPANVFHLATARDMTETERRRVQHLTPVDLYQDDDEEA